jgi:endoglucanase
MAMRKHPSRLQRLGSVVAVALPAIALLAPAPAACQAPAAKPFRPEAGIRVNSVGYLPLEAKRATVVGAADAKSFQVVAPGSSSVVYTGTLGEARHHADSGEDTRTADFSGLRAAGEYVLRVAGLPDSSPFRVAPGVYNDSLHLAMLGFYGQRCGVPVRLEHEGVVFQKAACHLKDGYLDYYDAGRAGERKDGTGGWHDAGDYGKYTNNAAFSPR